MSILNNADVAAKVRGAAARKRVTQSDLAASVPLSPMAMSRRMNGQTPFEPVELIRIAVTLGTSVGEFFGERGGEK